MAGAAGAMSNSTAQDRRLLATLIERSLTFELQACGLTPIAKPHCTSWRTLPTLVTAHIIDGADLMEFDDGPPITMRRGEGLCVRGGVRHRFTLITDGQAVSRWSHIQFTVFASLDLMAMLDPPRTVPPDVAVRIGDCNSEMVSAQGDDSVRGVSRRTAAAYRLLDIIVAGCPEPAKNLDALRDAQRLGPALSRLEERLGNADLDLTEMADAVSLSPSRFHAVFKRALGLAPARYLQQRRMARAEGLLLGTELKVHEVAERSGWADQFHFSRLFKRLHGVSPAAYREQARQKGI
jgi:AraC-like DNA-binding protein